jgi:hypothetical protein
MMMTLMMMQFILLFLIFFAVGRGGFLFAKQTNKAGNSEKMPDYLSN